MPTKSRKVKITVTEAHLAKALARPWSTTTCIIAQALPDAVEACGRGCASNPPTKTKPAKQYQWEDATALQAMRLFDLGHNGTSFPNAIPELRALLPFTFTAEVENV